MNLRQDQTLAQTLPAVNIDEQGTSSYTRGLLLHCHHLDSDKLKGDTEIAVKCQAIPRPSEFYSLNAWLKVCR